MRIEFTGQRIIGLAKEVPATCVVRNELNGWRKRNEVVRTHGSTVPHGLAYMPRPFPAGTWRVTEVVAMPDNTEFWPVFINTDAIRMLPVWELKDGLYLHKTERMFTGRGYGIHHARWFNGKQFVPSNTTLGCINVLVPGEAQWLGDEVQEALLSSEMVEFNVWEEWE